MPHLLNRTAGQARQRGLTLLESLVALVVLALGVLGMLGVQMRTQAETQTSVRRTQAVRLIEDLSERIKSNPQGFEHLANYVAAWDADVKAADCEAGSCTPAQWAAWDLQVWRASVAHTLPLGQAATFLPSDTTDTGARRMLGVMVAWRANERATTAGSGYATPFSVDTATQECPRGLICHRVYIQP